MSDIDTEFNDLHVKLAAAQVALGMASEEVRELRDTIRDLERHSATFCGCSGSRNHDKRHADAFGALSSDNSEEVRELRERLKSCRMARDAAMARDHEHLHRRQHAEAEVARLTEALREVVRSDEKDAAKVRDIAGAALSPGKVPDQTEPYYDEEGRFIMNRPKGQT